MDEIPSQVESLNQGVRAESAGALGVMQGGLLGPRGPKDQQGQ